LIWINHSPTARAREAFPRFHFDSSAIRLLASDVRVLMQLDTSAPNIIKQ
jgi:hypothetical protein